MKSRGVYETPGGTILLQAHRAMESITLDRGAGHLKDELMPRYAELIYNGFWFAPEREMLQAAIDYSQTRVSGQVRVKLYKGNVSVIGRTSPNSDQDLVTFEESKVAYDQSRCGSCIKLNAAPRVAARRDAKADGVWLSSLLYGTCRGSPPGRTGPWTRAEEQAVPRRARRPPTWVAKSVKRTNSFRALDVIE
jgi:hypothetical protein